VTEGVESVAGGSAVDEAHRLMLAYARSVDFAHCFEDIEAELEELPGEYAPPGGCLLLSREEGRAVGCVAVRRLTDEVCELKRLYVEPAARGTGRGRALTLAAVDLARGMGYRAVRLETLESMEAARGLYRSLGFVEDPSRRQDAAGPVVVMERALA
jgi:ribosomal protein S18 acetylase RimI-like enzyme